MNYKKHTLLLVSAVVLLSAGIVGVAMAQSVLFDKDIDLQGTKKVLNAMNVGIGTASPNTKLHVYNSTATSGIWEAARLQGFYNGAGSGPLLRFTNYHASGLNPNATEYNLAGIGAYDYSTSWDGALAFYTTPSGTSGGGGLQQRMVINPSGYVGIGTTTPGSRLTVSPVSSISGDMLSGRIQNLASPVNNADAATKNYVDTAFASAGQWTTSGSNIYMNLSGNVGIGTTAPAHKIDIVGSYYSRTVVKGTCSGTVAIDWNAGNTQHCVLGSTPVTFTFSGGQTGGNYKLILKQDGVGSRTVSWPATIRWGSGSAPYLTPVPAKTDYVGFIYNGVDGTYDSVAFNANF